MLPDLLFLARVNKREEETRGRTLAGGIVPARGNASPIREGHRHAMNGFEFTRSREHKHDQRKEIYG